jgi:hypothetical protein
MCLLLTLLLLGPRAGLFFYWLLWPARWEAAFESFIVPFIGFVFLPWTTVMYVIVAPDGVNDLDYLLLAFGAIFDVGSVLAGGYGRSRA